MTVTIKYIGAQQRWSELPYTGAQSVWLPGQIEERSDVDAAALMGTGLFSTIQGGLDNVELNAIRSMVSGAGLPTASPSSNPLSIRLNAQRSVLSKCWQGRVKSVASGANHSTRVCTVLETHTDRIRIGVINCVAADLVGVKVNVASAPSLPAASSSLATPAAGGSGWVSAPLAADTVSAGTDTNAVSITWTDWVNVRTVDRTDGGTLPVLFVTIQAASTIANLPKWNATNRSGWEDPGTATTAPYLRPFMARQQAVLAVDTTTAITSASFSGDCIPFVVQYVPREADGFTFMTLGDSILEGFGATVAGCGSVEIARAAVSTMSRPIEVCQMAVGSASAANMGTRATAVLASIAPELVYCSLQTPNSLTPPTVLASNISSMRINAQLARALAGANGARVLGFAGIPMLNDDSEAAGSGENYDTTISLLNAHIDGYLAGSMPVVDTYTPMRGVTDIDGQVRARVGVLADGLHPNDTGHALIAAPLKAALASVWW